jgi:hypothetical protein
MIGGAERVAEFSIEAGQTQTVIVGN